MIVTCRRFIETLTDAREGAVPGWERPHLDEHAHDCRPCRKYLEGFERTVALLHELPEERPPEGMREALMARFRAQTAPKEPGEGGSTSG